MRLVILVGLTATLLGCYGFRPDILALRAETSATTSLRAPDAGFGLDVSALLEAGTYDFMGGSFTMKATPDVTQLGGRYDWEISNLTDFRLPRVIIHLGAGFFGNLYDDGTSDGGLEGMAQVRYEYVWGDSSLYHGIALALSGQIDITFIEERFDFFTSAGIGYTVYIDGL